MPGETVRAGWKLQEGEERLKPRGPQIPPGPGSLDSVGGGGGGRGLSSPEGVCVGGGCNSLRREAWPLAAGPADPPLGRGWAWVRGQLLGLGLAGHWAGSHSLWCLYLLSLSFLSLAHSL